MILLSYIVKCKLRLIKNGNGDCFYEERNKAVTKQF